MRKTAADILFFAVASAVILPAPTMAWAWVTGRTLAQVLYR